MGELEHVAALHLTELHQSAMFFFRQRADIRDPSTWKELSQRIGASRMTPAFKSNPLDCSGPVIPVFSPTLNPGTEFLKTLPKATVVADKTILVQQNERIEYVYVIRSGILKITSISEDGSEHVHGLRSEGWWAGAASAVINLPSVVTVTAITQCTVAAIPVAEFSQLLIANYRLLKHFILSQAKELMVEQMHGIMSTCSASARIDHLEREGRGSAWEVADPGSIMRKREIAQLLDITPEHLSRLTHGKIPTGPQLVA